MLKAGECTIARTMQPVPSGATADASPASMNIARASAELRAETEVVAGLEAALKAHLASASPEIERAAPTSLPVEECCNGHLAQRAGGARGSQSGR